MEYPFDCQLQPSQYWRQCLWVQLGIIHLVIFYLAQYDWYWVGLLPIVWGYGVYQFRRAEQQAGLLLQFTGPGQVTFRWVHCEMKAQVVGVTWFLGNALLLLQLKTRSGRIRYQCIPKDALGSVYAQKGLWALANSRATIQKNR